MKIPCSNCNQRLDIPEEYAGQTIECPACKVSLSVPTMVRTESATPSVEVPKFDNKKKNKKRIVSNSSSSSDKHEMSIPKWAIVLGIFSLVMILILLFSSTLANVILQFVCAAVSIICFIGTVKSMFDLGKSGIAWGSIVLFFLRRSWGIDSLHMVVDPRRRKTNHADLDICDCRINIS